MSTELSINLNRIELGSLNHMEMDLMVKHYDVAYRSDDFATESFSVRKPFGPVTIIDNYEQGKEYAVVKRAFSSPQHPESNKEYTGDIKIIPVDPEAPQTKLFTYNMNFDKNPR